MEERVVRSMRTAAVKCFKCGEEEHKCKECPLWRKKEKKVERVVCPVQGEVHQPEKRKPAHPIKGKVQEEQRKLRRVEEEKAVRMAKPRNAQQGWRRSLIEKLRKRAEEHCGKGVPEEAQLWDLGWCMREVVVLYLVCIRCGEQGCHVKDNRDQGVISRRRLEQLNWCGCQKRKEEGVVQPRKTKA